MMETVEVTDHRSGQDLLSNVQIVSSEGGRVEVLSKMAPVTVTSIMPNQDIMTAQYINLHRMPEHLNKVIVTDPISGELHHVDLSGSADFGHHTVTAQYYDTEELLAHGLTEDERRLAAELVAAQLKSQQQGTTILTTQDLLNAKTLTAQDLLNAKTLTTQDLLNAKALTTQDLLNAKALTTQDLLNGKALTTQDLLNGKTLTTQDLLNAKTLTTQDLLNAKTLTTQDLLNAKTLTTQDLLNAKTLTTQDLLNAKTLTTQDLLNAKTLTTQDLLNAKALTSLGTVSLDKSNLSAAIVTGYLQTVDEVQQQMLQQDNQERCIMKIYPTQGQHELQVLNRTSSQPLPPLKKVLSSQSMMVRNKFSDSPGIMVELQNSDLLDTSQVPNNCIKPEHLDNNTPVVMTTAASSTPPTTSLPSHHPPSTNTSLNQSGPTAADDLDSEDYDAENDTARAASRKSLPHKKRFPRKLKGQGGGAPSGGAVRNPAQKTYKCAKCGESCGTQAQLAAHKLTHLAPVKRGAAGAGSGTGSAASFNCELCQKQFGTQLKFFEHLKQHYEPGGGVMGVVGMEGLRVEGEGVMGGMVGSVQQDMGKEMVEQHNSMKVEAAVTSTGLTCAHCGKVFRRQKALETHVSVAHPSQDEIEEFSEPEDMMEGIRHVVNMPAVDSGDEEGGEEKMRWRYQLNASASNYTSMGGDMGAAPMQTLQDMHTLEAAAAAAQPPPATLPPPQAPDGGQGEEAAGGGTVPKGSVKVDSVDGEKRTALMCLECNRVFNHRNSLLYHLRSHSGLRPHQCDVCGKGFISGSALKVHMRLHSGDKPYKCEHCSRHFRQWGDLKYHVTSLHSDQKQFQCEYCGKDFARKYSLNVHRRIHTGEKNYKCEFCGKTFRASSYLKNHTRIHTGEKPHCCDLCGKPFRVRSDMKRHRRTHTKDSTTAAAYLTARDEDDEVELIEDEAARMHQESRLHHQSHLVEGEDESSETILPDQAPIPLNLNIKGADVGEGEEELVYTTTGARGAHHSVDSRDGTLYVWIPAAPDSILSDE